MKDTSRSGTVSRRPKKRFAHLRCIERRVAVENPDRWRRRRQQARDLQTRRFAWVPQLRRGGERRRAGQAHKVQRREAVGELGGGLRSVFRIR